MRARRLLALSAAVVLGLTACSGSSATTASRRLRRASSDGGLTGTLTVFAAASLTDVFTELGDQLEADHPDLDVRFNFAGSSALATQITQGAPADVFASANQAQMTGRHGRRAPGRGPDHLRRERAGDRRAGGQPGEASPGLADFAERRTSPSPLCAPEVPCGAAADEGLRRRPGSRRAPDTLEDDVKAALDQGAARRGRRGAGLRDRRHRGRRQGRGHRVPRGGRRGQRLPDLRADGRAPNPAPAQAFVDLVAVRRGAEGARGRRASRLP